MFGEYISTLIFVKTSKVTKDHDPALTRRDCKYSKISLVSNLHKFSRKFFGSFAFGGPLRTFMHHEFVQLQ